MNLSTTYAVFGISATTVLSLVYFLLLDFLKKKCNEDEKRIRAIYMWRKISGFLLFGAIPAILAWILFGLSPDYFGTGLNDSLALWPWLLGATVFFVALNFFNSRNPDLYGTYPEMRLKSWNLPMLLLAAGGWILYLAGYEFLFRGILLGSCYEAFGLWPAVAINLSLYSALHLPKGMKEAIATIPFGALVCYLTIESHSILPAIYLHSLQAVSCEMFCISRNPDMVFNFSKTHQP